MVNEYKVDLFVWAVTTIRLVDRQGFPFVARTIGLFQLHGEAVDAILGNWGDMNEAGYYPWAVVEKVSLNCIYPLDREQTWFRWDGQENGQYKQFDGKEVTHHPALGDWAGRIANWSNIG